MDSSLLKAVAHERLTHNLQIRTLTPTPAVGGEVILTVPGGEDWRVIGVRARLVTSAVVANRVPTLCWDDQTNIGGQISSQIAVPASTTVFVNFVAEASFASAAISGGVIVVPMPAWILPTAYRLRTITNLIDVGDQYDQITFSIERMDEPPWRLPMVGTALDDAVQHEIAMGLQGG